MVILKTQNKSWGFWGTASDHIESKKEMQAFWDKTAEIIQLKGLTPQQTLGLMDSRWGRHIADEFAEELSTNLETFAETFKRQMSTIRLIKEYRYYVDPKAFSDVNPRAYENFAKDLTKLCKIYGVTIKSIGGVVIHSQDEMKRLIAALMCLMSSKKWRNIMPKYPDITVKLVGADGNAFNILGICLREMRKAGLSHEERDAFQAEATSGNYDHLLATCMEWFNVE